MKEKKTKAVLKKIDEDTKSMKMCRRKDCVNYDFCLKHPEQMQIGRNKRFKNCGYKKERMGILTIEKCPYSRNAFDVIAPDGYVFESFSETPGCGDRRFHVYLKKEA